MIKISKRERFLLEKDGGLTVGVPFEPDIVHSWTKSKTYWMAEKPKNLKLLEKLRNGESIKKNYHQRKDNKKYK